MLTVGVEEEFLLLHPDGAVAPIAPDVARLAEAGDSVIPEFMAYQLETRTPVCTTLADLRTELTWLRLRAAQGAERAGGARLVATGAAPFAAGPVDALTDDERYRQLARRFPGATSAGRTCACQVHVGVPDRDLAVAVLARLRPWLPTLLALTVNSPFTAGVDSGWASRRYRAQLRWPTFRPPEPWPDAERYDHVVHALVRSGAAMDAAGVYFLARLSPRYPTVEVRVGDVCLSADDTVMFAGVVRTLVTALIDDIERGVPSVGIPTAAVHAGLMWAARHGMRRFTSRGADEPETVPTAVARLLSKISPFLHATGDADEVHAGLDRLLRTGTGADRQRLLWAHAAGPDEFVTALADATVLATAVH
ncbi:MAG TPA: YbdK family carboxylate-amine ligase [Actinoplanes sp.]